VGAAFFCATADVTQAVEFRRVEVGERDGRYYAEVEARLDVPFNAVWTVLSDFSRLPEISPAVQESETLGPHGPDAWIVATRSRSCVLWLCREIKQVQRILLPARGSMRADIDPDRSDFSEGVATWQLENEAGFTVLRFSARIKPDFTLPPWIGPWLVKRAVREEARQSAVNLERLAGELAR